MVAFIRIVSSALGLTSMLLAVAPGSATQVPALAQSSPAPESVQSEDLPAPQLPHPSDLIRPRPQLPETEVLPEEEPNVLPETPLAPFPALPPADTVPSDGTVFFPVQSFAVEGNTVFGDAELIEVIQTVVPVPQAQVTVADLFLAADAIAQHYGAAGYLTTGALPAVVEEGQRLDVAPDGLVTFQIIEGGVEAIEVSGTQRLPADYVRSRLALATDTPLNQARLIDALQLLHADPLIESVQAVLVAGTQVGSNILQVVVQEAKTFQVGGFLDNQRSPNVGTLQRGIQLSESNLLGWGDRVTITYNNTDGSDGVGFSYRIPLNPKAGTLTVSYSHTENDIITPELEVLGIESTSDYIDVTWRQPLIRTPRQEFALGLTGSHRRSRAVFGEDLFGTRVGFPVGDGRSQTTALRFFQDWVSRSEVDAVALRSQFSFGINAQAPSITGTESSRFFSWQGLAQYRRRLGRDTFLVARGDIQLANRSLIPLEQFSLGGQGSVRGYREDLLLADNGAFASVELWLPVLRVPEFDGVLQLTPFVDVGTVWHSDGAAIDPNDLASVGLGLQWQQDELSARLDWGIPLVSVTGEGDSLQENGLHFSIFFNPF